MAPPTQHPPITLHLGAHRTGTTSLQRLMRRNADVLRDNGTIIWGPKRTRSNLMDGLLGDPGRVGPRQAALAQQAADRIALRRARMTRDGVENLIISEENLLGTMRENMMLGRLYPTATARLERIKRAMPGVQRICLSIRSPDAWWTSAFAFLMTRGFAPPDNVTLETVLGGTRSWRDVITDIAAVFPDADLNIWPFEERGGDPADLLTFLTGHVSAIEAGPPTNASLPWSALRDRLRDAGWTGTLPGIGDTYAPFHPDDRAMLRARHAEDVAWLRGGADGIASFHGRGVWAVPRPKRGIRYERCEPSARQMGATG